MTATLFRNLNPGDWVETGQILCEIKELVRTFPHHYKVLCWGATKFTLIIESDCASFERCDRPIGNPELPLIDPDHADKIRLTTCNEVDFNDVMVEIDEKMAEDEIPITGRELFGVTYICRRFGFSLGLHEPLAMRMRDWFGRRYGDRLKVDLRFSFPMMVGRDIYRMRIHAFVSGQIICVPKTPRAVPGQILKNVLDDVEGLTAERRALVFHEELVAIRKRYLDAINLYHCVSKTRNEPGFIEGFGDLETAIDVLFHQRPQLGASRWSSLQASEKFLKAWLKRRGDSSWGHVLLPLAEKAEALGLPTLDRTILSLAQCTPNVRYVTSGITSSEAVEAVYASYAICAHVTDNL